MSYPLRDPIIDALLVEEGWPTYSNAPGDQGGPTKGGITLALLQRLRPGATIDDLKNLEEPAARAIYAEVFVVAPGFDKIADGLLRWQVVDCGVNSGPGKATRWLQEAAGCAVDGQLGPTTLAAVNSTNPQRLGIRLGCIRLRFFASLVQADLSQAKWMSGWTARATRFLEREAVR